MNSIALNRIVKKNQRAKVQQLSEIATLFEKEIRVRNQLSEIKQLGNELSNQKDANFNLTSQLPKGFLDQENAKCKQLLNTLSSSITAFVLHGSVRVPRRSLSRGDKHEHPR